MREILFRGKRIDNGEWVESGSIIKFHRNDMYIPKRSDSLNAALDKRGNLTQIKDTTMFKIDPSTIGQFTGLTDKNGKNIFEGDIVKFCCDEAFSINKVFFKADGSDGEAVGFYVSEVSTEYEDAFDGFFAQNCEVIGNIHDNPELLEVTSVNECGQKRN